MQRSWTEKLVDVLTIRSRLVRLLFFGGALLAWVAMKMLGKIFGVNTNIGGDIDLPNIILIAVSLFIGFGASYGIVRYLDGIKRRRD